MKRLLYCLAAVIGLGGIIVGCSACTSADNNTAGETVSADNVYDDSLTVTFLDVGKGDCILITKDGYAALIDAGYDTSSSEILSFLQKKGVNHLDDFIITHYDKDHAGGAAAIAEKISIRQIYLPGYEGKGKIYTNLMNVIAARSISSEKVTQDISFRLSDADFTIYASELEYVYLEKEKEGNDNDVSLVIELHYADDSYLFAGDLEEAGIDSYLTAGHTSCDVVKMPHHGRKEKNTDLFIENVQPKIAVITDSEEEGADKKVLKLLESAGAAVYRSSECGTITMTGTGTGEYTVSTEN